MDIESLSPGDILVNKEYDEVYLILSIDIKQQKLVGRVITNGYFNGLVTNMWWFWLENRCYKLGDCI